MRQGPSMCACHLGFDPKNYNNKCKKTTLQPFNQEVFVEIHLHLTKKSHRKTLVVIPSTKRNEKMPRNSIPSTSVPHNFSQ
jgi:hypothetical protein